jgi:hypothetical protein
MKLKKRVKRLMTLRLDALKFGLAGGILGGVVMFLMTVWMMYIPSPTNKFLIMEIYGLFGYDVTWLGAVIGAVYGFVDSFIFFGVFAWLYNKLI